MADTDLLLLNALVRTMGPNLPLADAVGVSRGRIVGVGHAGAVRGMLSSPSIIDCRGLTMLPGFIDAHCHLPAMARTESDLECGPGRANTIPKLQQLLRGRAATTPAGEWVRGYGYDDRSLAEDRHPTRWDLDAAVSAQPVRLDHRSGHATVLNSRGLELAGINRDTAEPSGGTIHRRVTDGEPTGLLFEMAGFLRRRLGNTRSPSEFEAGMRAVSDRLLGYGITSVHDAGADNNLQRWQTLGDLQKTGVLLQRVTMMAGAHVLDQFLDGGMGYGFGGDGLRLGHAKIMLTMSSGMMHPSPDDLGLLVIDSHAKGFPVAIHAVEEAAVYAAATALREAAPGRPSGLPPDRIEHCAECPPWLLAEVAASGATVVTQPGFVYFNGPDYRQRVERRMLPHLYPAASLYLAGVKVAFGSDAPVIDPNPWPAIYSAVTGHAQDGRPMDRAGEDSQLSVAEALRMYTAAAAESGGTQQRQGVIRPGGLADLVLLDTDPLSTDLEGLHGIAPVMTVLGGRIVWQR